MPSTSPAQHRAMEAAAHGHSTLGIPKKVGQEFATADAHPHHADPPAPHPAMHPMMGGGQPMAGGHPMMGGAPPPHQMNPRQHALILALRHGGAGGPPMPMGPQASPGMPSPHGMPYP